MDNYSDLNSMHFDILREIGNIGSGNAVTALAKLLNKKVDMSVPAVRILEFKDIADFIGGAENIIVGILVNISGDINGIMMFLLKLDSAHTLLHALMDNMGTDEQSGESGSEDEQLFSEIEFSALEEIGNILISSYLGSLAGLINKYIKPSVPFLNIDMANAILSVPAIEFGKVADDVLFIESVFRTNEEESVSGYFLLVPDMPSFDVILKSLGVM